MAEESGAQATGRGRQRAVALVCAGVAAGMIGAAYAAVPLYDWFCRVTGMGGTVRVAAAAPARVTDRLFEIRLDANVRGLPWRFRPAQPSVTVKAGEVATVDYVVENLSAAPTIGTATYNVTPDLAGSSFNKLACFCFTEQRLEPGERLVLPVTFFVDPDIDRDPNRKYIRTITLSYSFFPARTPEKPVAALSGKPASE